MKHLLLCVAMVLAIVAISNAQLANSPHDLTQGAGHGIVEICAYCHTPHSGTSTTYLWNRQPTTGTYVPYTSSTMDASTDDATIKSSTSANCLTCHDGVMAFNQVLNLPGSGFNPPASNPDVMPGGVPGFIGQDLTNDHPISIIYETARNATATEFQTQVENSGKVTVTNASTPTINVPLSGSTAAAATVECGSCHDPHSTANQDVNNPNFMRFKNTSSQLCLSCHIK